MTRRSLPDMDAKLSPEEASRIKRETMIHCLNAKADWMERTLGPLMPREIYRMVHDTSGSMSDIEHRHEIVRKFLKSQDIRIEERGLNARIMKGRKQVGQAFAIHLTPE